MGSPRSGLVGALAVLAVALQSCAVDRNGAFDDEVRVLPQRLEPREDGEPRDAGPPFPSQGVKDLVRLSAQEAFEMSFEVIAESRGLTVAQARETHEASLALARVADRLVKERPAIFVGAVAPQAPDEAPTLLLKGSANREVQELVAQEERFAIRISDQYPYSFEELEARKVAAHEAVVANGYRNVGTGVDPDGTVRISVGHEPGLPSEADEILPALPEELREQATITFMEADAFKPESAIYAGLQMNTNPWFGFHKCTTGFSVTVSGTPVFLTAGHCSSPLNVEQALDSDDNEVFTPLYGFYSHRGNHGDFALHIPSGVAIEPRFKASGAGITDVTFYWPYSWIPTGSSVCLWSGKLNELNCPVVEVSSEMCTAQAAPTEPLVTVNNITVMDSDVSAAGDSGSPWYVGSWAYGIHYGKCGGRSGFTLIDEVREEWVYDNIQVMLAN